MYAEWRILAGQAKIWPGALRSPAAFIRNPNSNRRMSTFGTGSTEQRWRCMDNSPRSTGFGAFDESAL
jgi:hypothetical protein